MIAADDLHLGRRVFRSDGRAYLLCHDGWTSCLREVMVLADALGEHLLRASTRTGSSTTAQPASVTRELK